MRYAILFFLGTLLMPLLQAQESGYRISIGIDNYEQDSLFLGYYYGDKQYLRDTVTAGEDGKFVFSAEEPLPAGMYLVVMPPNNDYFQLVINDGEQEFAVRTSRENPVKDLTVEGSQDNQLLNDYLDFLNAQRPKAEAIQKKISEAAEGSPERQELEQQLEEINDEVSAYQQSLVKEHPNTLTAAIVRANQNADFPEFAGTPEEQQEKRWRYMQKHWFDNVDLSDPRVLRMPFLFDKIDAYVHKLQVQYPDTISRAIDYVLEKTGDAKETYRYYLVHYLNEAARSNIVGMDAVYVHLVENHYKPGRADWSDEESLKKIIENSDALKPLLIGKTAPNLLMQKRDGSKITLHDVDSKYTVLYFWMYDCSHCKKSTPVMKEFYEKFKDKGVELFAVCAKSLDDVPACWEYVDENEIGDWLHTVDPYNRSRYGTVYNVKSTPQIYVLDRNKEILSKGIGAGQLEEVINRIIEMDEAGGD